MLHNIMIPAKFVFIGLGIIIAVLGALYSASVLLDKEGSFFKDLTQTLTFGVSGGIIIGIGFGAFGPLFTIANAAIPSPIRPNNPLLNTSASLSMGLVLGIILGLLTGWGYKRIQTPHEFPTTKREVRGTFIVTFCLLLFIAVVIQAILFQFVTIPIADLTAPPGQNSRVAVNIPLFFGCATSFIYQRYIHNLFESEDNIYKYILLLLFILINIFILFLYSIIIMLHPNGPSSLWSLSRIIAWARDFIFGFLITNELNHQQKPETPQDKPSWIKFFFWTILLGICGVMLNYIIYSLIPLQYKQGQGLNLVPLTEHVMKLAVLIGLMVGIRKGQIDAFIKQPNRAIFIFLIGLTVFGLYTFSNLFSYPLSSINSDKISTTIYSSLTNSIPIGLLIGCVYVFRPLFSNIQDLPVERLGEIFGKMGVILTVVSIILLNILDIM